MGKIAILVDSDIFTKWVEAFSTGHLDMPTIHRLLVGQVFNRYGYPRTILTDNGQQFISWRWKRDLRQWGVAAHHTGRYHIRANPVERHNQEIKKG